MDRIERIQKLLLSGILFGDPEVLLYRAFEKVAGCLYENNVGEKLRFSDIVKVHRAAFAADFYLAFVILELAADDLCERALSAPGRTDQ